MSYKVLRRTVRRSPYGERGLKYDFRNVIRHAALSLSLRRAWIEILNAVWYARGGKVALLTESVD